LTADSQNQEQQVRGQDGGDAGTSPRTSAFTAAEIAAILRKRGWLGGEISAGQGQWCENAAQLLGPHAADAEAIEGWLELVFHYDAREILTKVDSHVVLSRHGAREVVRRLAVLLIGGPPLSSERFKEVVASLKAEMESRGRELFHPIRLVLAGKSGEGELDRVILLVDQAAEIEWRVPVKGAAERILEFCAALD
jgi:hypothetical protein